MIYNDLVAPTPSEVVADTAPFWRRAAQEELVLPQCDECATLIWYPRPFCPECGSTSTSWIVASGNATLYSFTVVRAAPHAAYKDAGQYVLAYVTLAEGPTIMTNVVAADPDDLEIGQELSAVFCPVPDTDYGLVRFRPAHGGEH